MFFAVFLPEVRSEIPCEGIALSHHVGCHKAVGPHTFPFRMGKMEIQCFHLFG
ncbi:hypothetical protein JCM21738_5593 [Mesobacillus boroniphilus JCM 21738]|uniref:Uncharacterized protein n=1 Tax=Mesobacillus boroniphilus JCM 21738 TaxID=1294265 RepID=W4RXT9_9BACI|nr:hypothetical protein JCM21738_5593 [Mesobacillus boroniphilus JCM 21738]